MKIAIHHRVGSYSDLWIEYCKKHKIQHKIVDAYANDILEQVADCDAFMWHFHHHIYQDNLFAKQLIYVIEKRMGKITYPNFDTCWHFDDKIGQRYLLKAINAPLAPTYIFYTRAEALKWILHATFPKVFKLRSGSSSENVRLVKSAAEAKKLTKQAFSKGFENNGYFRRIYDRWERLKKGTCTFRWFLKSFITNNYNFDTFHKEEKRYVYFQDFIPNNDFDIRVLVIGNRAIAKKRINRINDFRASGSFYNIFDEKQIDLKYIKISFEINKKLKMQSVAFDFLHDSNGMPILTEISYCSGIKNYKNYSGYWTSDLQWHQCKIPDFCNFIIEDVIAQIKSR
ncbi:MAG: hypothetical protein IKW86_09985 [Salinivirgaceae bacterium]|nr:hypothetical protein [Salinivirgaceae bacterium]